MMYVGKSFACTFCDDGKISSVRWTNEYYGYRIECFCGGVGYYSPTGRSGDDLKVLVKILYPKDSSNV